jgi:hypothetical protein
MIEDTFSAAAFGLPRKHPSVGARILNAVGAGYQRSEVHRHHERLAAELQSVVGPRILGASDPKSELELVVNDLRTLGHELKIDEDSESSTIYADLPNRNLAVWVHWVAASTSPRVSHVEVLLQKM